MHGARCVTVEDRIVVQFGGVSECRARSLVWQPVQSRELGLSIWPERRAIYSREYITD
jgi:hypothetical protein